MVWRLLILFLTGSFSAVACPPQATSVRFQGTVFASEPFQVQGKTIYLFRGSPDALALAYNSARGQWCYRGAQASAGRPAAGCFKAGNKDEGSTYTLRRTSGQVVAKLRMQGKRLSASLRTDRDQDSGKRLVFTDLSSLETESLDVRGWNCPNPRYLSCVGAQLQTSHDAHSVVGPLRVTGPAAELSKNLGHYRASSCLGLREVAAQPVP